MICPHHLRGCGSPAETSAKRLKLSRQEKSATNVYANISAKLNGKFVKCDDDYENTKRIVLHRSDDGLFYGVANYSDVSFTDKSSLEIEISGLRSVDASYVKWTPDNPDNYYGSGNYEAEETIFSDKFNFTSGDALFYRVSP